MLPMTRFFSSSADNLAKRGWPHNPICPLCRCHAESACRLFATCYFARSVWVKVLQRVNLSPDLAPTSSTDRLSQWWQDKSAAFPGATRKQWNTLVTLV